MIWDKIILEANKFRPYLDYIVDQESGMKVARHDIFTVKQGLNKKPMEITQNAVNFLRNLSEEQTSMYGIQNIVAFNSGARKVVGKQRKLDTVQAKIDIIVHKVKGMLELFKPLVSRGIPFFWE